MTDKPEHVTKDAMSVDLIAGKTTGYTLARTELEPAARHGCVTRAASTAAFASLEQRGGLGDHIDAVQDLCGEVAGGDLSIVSRMLTAQATTLDTLFTQMAAKSIANAGEYLGATEIYMRMALKAQAQSRATLETLMRMHQPREQTVRHIHVGPEGQAVFIENMHGGFGNVRNAEPAHAQSSLGPALLGHDALGNGVPITSGEGEAAVPHARGRRGKRSAVGQP